MLPNINSANTDGKYAIDAIRNSRASEFERVLAMRTP
jgi:hypothetical protein